MVLVPVCNAWQENIVTQLIEVYFHARSSESYTFSGITDTQHTHSLAGDKGSLPEGLNGITAAIVAGYHAKTGGAAIHGV